MSRTQKSGGSSSPVKRYLEFKGSKGVLQFHDKEDKRADEKGNVQLKSLDFVILDVKSSISGFNESSSSGISSNMLDPFAVGTEEFIVKSKVNGQYGVVAKGIYKDIKDEMFAIGGKFTTNVFAMADVGHGMEMVRIELNGSALSPWIEFTGKLDNNDDIYDLFVTMTKGQLCTRKKGKTEPVTDKEYKDIVASIQKDPMFPKPVLFYASAFTSGDLDEAMVTLAEEKDAVLQEYLGVGGKPESKDDEPVASSTSPSAAPDVEEDHDDLPF